MNGLQRPVGVWRILRVSCRCGSNIPLRSEFPLPLPFEAGAGAGGGWSPVTPTLSHQGRGGRHRKCMLKFNGNEMPFLGLLPQEQQLRCSTWT